MRLWLFLLVVLLTGCTTMADRLHGSLQPPPGEGNAIVSFTAWAFRDDETHAQLRYQGVADSSIKGSLDVSLITDTVFGEEGMSPVGGKLHLLTLPPGQYRFTDVYGYTRDDDGLLFFGTRAVHLPVNRSFTIRPGETVYLGEVRLDMSYRPEVKFQNSQPRDFGHIHRVWHVSDTSHIVVRPLAPADQQH
jgi:hypothetical protein